MVDGPNVIKKNNAWVCKVLSTHRIPTESHAMLKLSTMTEFLSYGQLPFMQVRADLNIKKRRFQLIKLTTSSYLSYLFWRQYDHGKLKFQYLHNVYRKNQWGKGFVFNIHYPPVIFPFFWSCSCLERIFSTGIFLRGSELTFVTLTSFERFSIHLLL